MWTGRTLRIVGVQGRRVHSTVRKEMRTIPTQQCARRHTMHSVRPVEFLTH